MSGEKTEPPTQKRIRDSRQKGQVSQSKDVSSTVILLCLFAYIGVSWRWYVDELKEMIILPSYYIGVPFEEAAPQVGVAMLQKLALLSMPPIAVALLAGLAAGFGQVGVLLSFEPLIPKLSKLNPFSKLKEMFSVKALIELVKSALKMVFLGYLLYLLIRDSIDPLLRFPSAGPESIMELLPKVLMTLALNVSLAYIVVAVFDYFFQKIQFLKGLKMSKDEIKQEYKEMEGNPEIKGKRKQLAKELAMNDTMQRTRKATVLVTNPTHYAIALQYDGENTKLPMVTAKGEGFLAKKMIEIAKEEGIPIMRNVPLAHALFDQVPADQYIPRNLIEPVAEVLRWVQQLKSQ